MNFMPWQAQWKRPFLHVSHKIKKERKVPKEKSGNKGGDESVEDRYGQVCTCTSSELNVKESELLIENLKKLKEKKKDDDYLSLSSFILDVKILNSKRKNGPSCRNSSCGDEFIISVSGPTKAKPSTNDRRNENDSRAQNPVYTVFSKNLRWPSSVMGEGKRQSEKGVISVCFCRVSEFALDQLKGKNIFQAKNGSKSMNENSVRNDIEDLDEQEKIADAIDALRLLSLFSTSDIHEEGQQTKSHRDLDILYPKEKLNKEFRGNGGKYLPENKNTDAVKTYKRLMLCCLTDQGQMHFFPALDLIFYQPPTPDAKDLKDSFSALFLGKVAHETLESNVLPLSNPIVSISLTLCQLYHQEKQKLYSRARKKNRRKIININLPNDLFDLTFLDATMDPSFARYRTIANKATSCISSRDYVAVCGKGVRKRRINVQNGELSTVFGDDESTIRTKASHKIEENDQTQLTTEINEEENTKNNETLTVNSAITEDDSKWGEHEADAQEEGGFISFISLRHWNETKTLFLPFAPTKLSAIGWKGMQFIICLRGPYTQFDVDNIYQLNQLDKADVIAIRIDSNLNGDFDVNSNTLPQREDESPSSLIETLETTSTSIGKYGNYSESAYLPHDHDMSLLNSSATPGSPPTILQHQQSFKEISLPSSNSLKLQRLRRFKPIPVLGNMLELLESKTASITMPSEDIRAGNDTEYVATDFRILDMNVNTNSSPPSLTIVHKFHLGSTVNKMATLHSFEGLEIFSQPQNNDFDKIYPRGKHEIILKTSMQSRHFAIIERRQSSIMESIADSQEISWCQGGQGWSIIGGTSYSNVFFICWEGASLTKGAYVQPLFEQAMLDEKGFLMPTHACNVYPATVEKERADTQTKEMKQDEFQKTVLVGESLLRNFYEDFDDPFSTLESVRNRSRELKKIEFGRINEDSREYYSELPSLQDRSYYDSIKENEFNMLDEDPLASRKDIIQEALDSISEMSNIAIREKNSLDETISEEKSNILLQFCTSWNELEGKNGTIDTKYYEENTIAVTIHGPLKENHTITLRHEAMENHVAAPFNQILAWLCQNNNFYVASAVALRLLNDSDALNDLQGNDLASLRTNVSSSIFLSTACHDGLLDGIIPIDLDDKNALKNDRADKRVFLSDMAVGCMVKGGGNMVNTLQGFLQRNSFYDENRACLLLAATAAIAISSNEKDDKNAEESKDKIRDNRLWPIKCLLQVAVTRDCMETCLKLLHSIIPNELYTLPQAKEIVTLILSSTPMASSHLLNIKTSAGDSYWESLDHNIRMVFSLLKINDEYPMLKEREVQHWVKATIYQLILRRSSNENDVEPEIEGNRNSISIESIMSQNFLPSTWITNLCIACLENAQCRWENLTMLDKKDENQNNAKNRISNMDQSSSDNLEELKQKRDHIRRATTPRFGSSGIDFGIIIPALLELQLRSEPWYETAFVSTQELLNGLCDAAGRKMPKESAFEFKAGLVMRQCALARNVMAAANLIGGKDGIVLKCCDALMNTIPLSNDECEQVLLDGKAIEKVFQISDTGASYTSTNSSNSENEFQLSNELQSLLSLLEEHIISIQKYGEFETKHTRGRVDPIYAGRVIFRAWLCIVKATNQVDLAADWMKVWLHEKLSLDDQRHRKRLACAALVHILLWPDENVTMPIGQGFSGQLLAEELHYDEIFLTSLAQACCGMVECLPKSVASQILTDPKQ